MPTTLTESVADAPMRKGEPAFAVPVTVGVVAGLGVWSMADFATTKVAVILPSVLLSCTVTSWRPGSVAAAAIIGC